MSLLKDTPAPPWRLVHTFHQKSIFPTCWTPRQNQTRVKRREGPARRLARQLDEAENSPRELVRWSCIRRRLVRLRANRDDVLPDVSSLVPVWDRGEDVNTRVRPAFGVETTHRETAKPPVVATSEVNAEWVGGRKYSLARFPLWFLFYFIIRMARLLCHQDRLPQQLPDILCLRVSWHV